MPSARAEVAVAEAGGKIYVVGGFAASANSKCTFRPWTAGAAAPQFRVRCSGGVVGGVVGGGAPPDDVAEKEPGGERRQTPPPLPPPPRAPAGPRRRAE